MKSALFILLTLFLHNVDADCLFPGSLSTGSWYSSTKGVLDLSSSDTTTTIAFYDTDSFGTFNLTCETQDGDKYIFKSNSFTQFSLNWNLYVCFVLTSTDYDNKYIYHLGSDENSDANGERLKAAISGSLTANAANICDRASYDAGTEHIFLLNDGNEDTAAVDFPVGLQGVWWYTFKATGSLNTYCDVNSTVNTCSASDKKTMTYNYTECATLQAYSAGGVVKSMWSSSDANYEYVHVYNTDDSTDEGTTYRFTCYVIPINTSQEVDQVNATQYPQQCATSQTPTSVDSPGAVIVFYRNETCEDPTTTPTTAATTTMMAAADASSSTVLSTASAVGAALGAFFILLIFFCGALIFYYYKKRKEKIIENDKLPLSRPHPANTRLTNGDLYRDSIRKNGTKTPRDSKTPRTMNGDVKLNIDGDLGIRRENSILITMSSRGGSGLGPLEGPHDVTRTPVVPVEEPEKVIIGDAVLESETEADAILASTFLPTSPDDKNELYFTDDEIREIERNAEKENEKDDECDMDEIDDELGLPRLSRAFTPVMQPEEATLPTIAYKKKEAETDTEDDVRSDGIKKVKVRKHLKKKRVHSSKLNRAGSGSKNGRTNLLETPFLERIKKLDTEKALLEQKTKLEKEMKQIENEVIKARVGKIVKDPTTAASGSKYVVDKQGSAGIQRSDQRFVPKTPASGERRRFGDPPTDSSRGNRRKTPRLRHPMEIQRDNEEDQTKAERLKKKEEFWQEEKVARSGRRREHPEAVTIPSVKEDPFDHKEQPKSAPIVTPSRTGKSALTQKMERENTTFFDPPKDPKSSDDVFEKASHLWNYKTQTFW